MNERDYYFDNAKFFLMIFVVFGHFLRPYIDKQPFLHSLYVWIFFFHMPAFILISGYFAKNVYQNGYLQKIIKKLLIPYFVFQLLYSFYYSLLYEKETIQIDFLTPHWSLWFLVSLFSWNVMLLIFAKLPRSVSMMLALLLGVSAGVMEAEKWLSLSRTFTFFPFFLIGFFLKKNHFELLFSRHVRLFSLLALTSMLLLIYFLFPDLPEEWLYGSKSYETLGVHKEKGVLLRLSFYGISAFMTFCFMSLVPNRQLLISPLGTRTFYIYILHGFILKYLHATTFPEFIMTIHGYPLLLIISLLLMFILGSEPIVRFVRPLIEWGFRKKKRAVS